MTTPNLLSETLATVHSAAADRADRAITEAASGLLIDPAIKPGASVAIIEDTVYGQSGLRGVVKSGKSASGAGFTDVELPSGVIIPVQTTLLAVV
jgi:hypothetical protein